MRTFTVSMALSLLGVLSVVVGAVFVIPLAALLETTYMPPQEEWQVTSWSVDGDDLVLSGTVVKTRNCLYVPPPRARDYNGQNYLVDSQSRMRAFTWVASPVPQKFGPWRVINGAGKRLTFYQEFSCHRMWPTIVELGTLDAREESK